MHASTSRMHLGASYFSWKVLHAFYNAFSCTLFHSKCIQKKYSSRYRKSFVPYSSIPYFFVFIDREVLVIFLLSLLITLITLIFSVWIYFVVYTFWWSKNSDKNDKNRFDFKNASTVDDHDSRRAKIKKNWYFDCLCPRCQDPSELQTYFDAIKCNECNKGYKLPIKIDSDWQCSQCNQITSAQIIKALYQNLLDEAEKDQEFDFRKICQKLANLEKNLHPNNFLVVLYKKRLFDLFRLLPIPQEEDLKRQNLTKQVELGNELLKICDVLEPGFTLKRGRILRQLHLPSLELAKMDLKCKKISLLQFAAITKSVIRKMNDVVKCMEDFDLDNDVLRSE